MITKNYKIEHLFDLDIDFDKYPVCQNNIALLHNMLLNGETRVILDSELNTIGILSIMLFHKGVAGVYIIPARAAHANKKKTFVASIIELRSELDEYARANNLRRIETVTVDDKKHNRWMEYLGFLPDGIKQAYGVNGEDFIMWSKLWV